MYSCDICKEIPGAKDNWVLTYKDDKDRVEFRGHKKCIDKLEQSFNEMIKKKFKNRKKIRVEEAMKEMGFDMEEYRDEYYG